MGHLLSFLALLLFAFVFVANFVFSLICNVKDRKWFKYTSEKSYTTAFKIDVFGNNLFSDFWNITLSKKGDNYKFGVLGETISSVLGKKKFEKSLSRVGLILVYIIDFIDFTKWNKNGHCFASIQDYKEIEDFLKELLNEKDI